MRYPIVNCAWVVWFITTGQIAHLMKKELIYNHGIDYAFSDYHCNAAGTNGLDIDKIRGLIESRGLKLINFSPCNIGMYLGFLAMLDDRVSVSKNCFRLIARKG